MFNSGLPQIFDTQARISQGFREGDAINKDENFTMSWLIQTSVPSGNVDLLLNEVVGAVQNNVQNGLEFKPLPLDIVGDGVVVSIQVVNDSGSDVNFTKIQLNQLITDVFRSKSEFFIPQDDFNITTLGENFDPMVKQNNQAVSLLIPLAATTLLIGLLRRLK